MDFHIAMPVWGEHHIELFDRLCLLSHFAPGNLFALKGRGTVRYHLFTRQADADRLRAAPNLRRLSEVAKTDIHAFRLEEDVDPCSIDANQQWRKYNIVNASYMQLMSWLAPTEETILLPWTADLVLSRGFGDALIRHLDAGARVVLGASISCVAETFMPHMREHWLDQDIDAISVAPRDLVRAGLDHLHPYSRRNHWGSPSRTSVVSTTYWDVPGEGVIAHCYHLAPMALRLIDVNLDLEQGAAYHGTIDTRFACLQWPDRSKMAFLDDSDHGVHVEVSSERYRRTPSLIPEPRTVANFAQHVCQAARNGELGDLRAHLALSERPQRFSFVDRGAVWAAREAEALTVMREANRSVIEALTP